VQRAGFPIRFRKALHVSLLFQPHCPQHLRAEKSGQLEADKPWRHFLHKPRILAGEQQLVGGFAYVQALFLNLSESPGIYTPVLIGVTESVESLTDILRLLAAELMAILPKVGIVYGKRFPA